MKPEFKVGQIVWNVCTATQEISKATVIERNKIGKSYLYSIRPVGASYYIYGSNLFSKKADAVAYAVAKIKNKIAGHEQIIKKLKDQLTEIDLKLI